MPVTTGCRLFVRDGLEGPRVHREPDVGPDVGGTDRLGRAEPRRRGVRQAQAYIDALSGFELVPLPPSVEEEASSMFDTDPALQEAARGYAVISATTPEGGPTGVIFVIDMEPSFAALPDFEEGFAHALGEWAGSEPVAVTIAGADAYQIESPDLTGIAWRDDNLLGLVVGDDLAMMTDLVEALITANG